MSSLPVPSRKPSVATNLHSAIQQHVQTPQTPATPHLSSPTSNSTQKTPTSSPAPSTAAPPSIAPSMKRQKSFANSYARSNSGTGKSRRESDTKPLPEWNSSKVINQKAPSVAIARSKSYAASLKKGKSGNVLESNFDGASTSFGGGGDAEWFNGQPKSTRTLQGRVFELEGLLEIALKDLEAANSQCEELVGCHRFELDNIKMEMVTMKEEMTAEMTTREETSGVEIKLLKSENDSLRVKTEMQMKEISKLHEQGVLMGQTITTQEVELSSLKAECEGAKRRTAILQQEIVRLQEQAVTTAQDGMALEVEMESSLKTIDALNLRLSSEKDDHERQVCALKENFGALVNKLEAELTEIKASDIKKATEIISLNSLLVVAQTENTNLREALAKLENIQQQSLSTIDELKKTVSEHISHISSLTQQLEQFIENKNQLEVLLMERNTQVDTLREQIFDLNINHEKTVAAIQSTAELQLSQQTEELERLKNDLIFITQREQSLNIQATELTALLDSTRSESEKSLSSATADHEMVLESLKQSTTKIISEKESIISKLTESVASLTTRMEDAINNGLNMSKSLETASNELQISRDSLASHRSELEAMKLSAKTLASENDAKLSELKQESDVLRNQLKEAAARELDLSNQLNSMRKDLESAHGSMSSKIDELTSLKLSMETTISEQNKSMDLLRQEVSTRDLIAQETSQKLVETQGNFERKVAAAEATSSRHGEAMEALRSSYESSLATKDGSIALLTEQIKELTLKSQQTATRNLELEESLNKTLAELKRVETEHLKKSKELDDGLIRFQEQSRDIKSKNQYLSQEIETKNATIQDLQSQISSNETEYRDTLDSMTIKAANDLKIMQDEIDKLKSSGSLVDSLKLELENVQAEKTRLQTLVDESAHQSKLASIKITEYETTIGKMKEEAKYTTKRLEIVEKNLELMNARNVRRVQDSRFKNSESTASGRNSIIRSPEPSSSSSTRSSIDVREAAAPPTPSTRSSFQRSSSNRGSLVPIEDNEVSSSNSRPTSVINRSETPLDSVTSLLDSAFGL
ncbi:hypothetical protein BDR26DRAFT_918111 [Obelidium mucronatum]|nr:hypothetical protein BDR26DRAFT_918111 [Obelidium mucronatum]